MTEASDQRSIRSGLLRLAGVAGGVLVLVTAGPDQGSRSPSAYAPHPMRDAASLVNPFIGTGGEVDTFPGADVPFGMVQWSPDTPQRNPGGGYHYGDTSTRGFSLTHVSGPGCPTYGDVPFLPTVGPVPPSPNDASQPFGHGGELASPGYYAVNLGSAGEIRSELTVTPRSGLGRFTFPATRQANMLLKVGGSAAGTRDATARVVGNREVTGSASSGGFCGNHNAYTVYFTAQFSQPFTSYGTWGGESPGRGSLHGGQDSGIWLTFDARKKHTILARVGVSFVSVRNALQNARSEDPLWDFGSLREAAHATWNRLLARVQISGGAPGDQAIFYTALYHSLLHPNVFSDAGGQYTGFDNRLHSVRAGHAQYANFSGWDIYRSQAQLLALLAPEVGSDIAQSMVNDYRQSGMLPKWSVANSESYVMVGDPADAILADLYAFGARDFDARGALAAMVREATRPNSLRPGLRYWQSLGYLPEDGAYGCCNYYASVSTSLEYASADFAISRLAAALGDTRHAATFATRAEGWRNLFNPATGFVQPRLSGGQFVGRFDPTSTYGFAEGNAYQYTPMVPFDIRALITAMGGDRRFVARLDSFFTELNAGLYAPHAYMGNEPSLEIPWEYDYAHAAWKTQAVIRRIQTQLYSGQPAGEAGNDDLGEMSSWYVWSALGMYPETPGTAYLALGSPLFPEADISLSNDRTLRIMAPQAAPGAPYVQSLSLNAHDWSNAYLPPWVVAEGATLSFSLGGRPNTKWGAGPHAAPPSWQAGSA